LFLLYTYLIGKGRSYLSRLRNIGLWSPLKSIFASDGKDFATATYTDEPLPKKDVAPGQNFSRFSLLTKITAFAILGYPTLDVCRGSW
jgi:hypothetical protein